MNLSELQFNQAVTLADDTGFLGYVVGRGPDADDGAEQIVVAISNPGGTGLRGQRLFRLDRLARAFNPVKARGRA